MSMNIVERDRFGNRLPFSPLVAVTLDRWECDEARHLVVAVSRGWDTACMGVYPYVRMPVREAANYASDLCDAAYQRQMGHLPESAVQR